MQERNGGRFEYTVNTSIVIASQLIPKSSYFMLTYHFSIFPGIIVILFGLLYNIQCLCMEAINFVLQLITLGSKNVSVFINQRLLYSDPAC